MTAVPQERKVGVLQPWAACAIGHAKVISAGEFFVPVTRPNDAIAIAAMQNATPVSVTPFPALYTYCLRYFACTSATQLPTFHEPYEPMPSRGSSPQQTGT